MVWLPQTRTLFSGDVVYVDRLLGVLPVSHTKRWLDTERSPRLPRPRPTPRPTLSRCAHMKKAVDDGVDVSAAVASFDAKPFIRLLNAAELMPGNASRTYLEIERE